MSEVDKVTSTSSLAPGWLSSSAAARTEAVRSHEEFAAWSQRHAGRLQDRIRLEERLARGREAFGLTGSCAVCKRETVFFVDQEYGFVDGNGVKTPNWREKLQCWYCHLNCRMRAAIHFLTDEMQAAPGASIYISEQLTPMYKTIARLFPNTTGSEYLGADLPSGTQRDGLRHEDVTRLSFPEASFDHVLSFDVLEHVPDYRAALREMARCLKPGGSLLLTAPFSLGSPSTIVRAVIENGEIRHLMEPEYHGDPVTGSVLCFYHFGWDLLADMRAAGFSDAAVHFFWSAEYGYLGGGVQFLIMATR